MVAGYAVKELIERGLKPGELTIVSAEKELPYERPPLSKSFLAGKDTEDAIRINTADVYREKGIELQLGCSVSSVDGRAKSVRLENGDELRFEKLVVATGAAPVTMPIPGADLTGFHYLRSVEDSRRIRARAEQSKRAVVVGGGFIAMEAAAVLASKAIETTIVLRDDRVWKRFFTPSMSRFFEGYFAERGVRFVKQAEMKQASGKPGVESVTLSNGETVACDMVVAGIGVRPMVGALSGSGVVVADGVTVNEYLETAVPGIYAAGDVASYRDSIFGKQRRAEHWDNAVSQGQHCARALMGDRAPFVHVPYFFSDVFDLSYEFWGDTAGADRIVERGDVNTRSFSVWWLRETRLLGAFIMNRPDQERTSAPAWIEQKTAGDLA
jgi:NADPH-dependent 2,4-dienoyl-CoA reductase/sulfur reductase-like enzyme